jgi:hypothetical protein
MSRLGRADRATPHPEYINFAGRMMIAIFGSPAVEIQVLAIPGTINIGGVVVLARESLPWPR